MRIEVSGVHHVGLSVTDLSRSKQFYQDLFGWDEAGGDARKGYAFLSDGKSFITLWQQSQNEYDKSRAGLHHLAFAVSSLEDLTRAEQLLRKKGVRIHYEGIVPAWEGAKEAEIYFYDPDGIRLELFCPQGGEGRRAPVQQAPSCYLPD